MLVQLYVYDLSQGLARTMSRQWLGVQIDAVYHTSIVFEGIEYFYGRGIQTCSAGSTHHGKPMEVISLGETSLPMEVILEYLDSLRQIYTPESYDLFLHNCNNFSNDFAMFLVGKGIPEHITSLPQTVLNTPFGQMLRPTLDQWMRPITQAPVPQQQPVRPRPSAPPASISSETGKVRNVTSLREIEQLLQTASASCAVIFFTSSTCAPCKLVYQPYDDLAAEAGSKCVFIKVDLNQVNVGPKFSVRATPTFMTFLRGQKRDEWSGADPRQLRNNVQLLLDAANPAHPHLSRSLPTLLKMSLRPITYGKVPPLDKVVAKMGDHGKDPAVTSIVSFVRARETGGAIEAPLPDLPSIADFLRKSTTTLPPDLLFTTYDLARLILIDPRVSGFFAEEHSSNSHVSDTAGTSSPTISHLLHHVSSLGAEAPYNLRLTALHLSCNLFTSPLFTPYLLSPPLSSTLISLLTTSLLDDKHTALRTSAMSLAMNICAANHKIRMRAHTSNKYTDPSSTTRNSEAEATELPEEEEVELLASLLEILGKEQEGLEIKKMCVVCLGWLVYCADESGEVRDLVGVMDGRVLVQSVGFKGVEDRVLAREVAGLCS